jgi:hypothetical protein
MISRHRYRAMPAAMVRGRLANNLVSEFKKAITVVEIITKPTKEKIRYLPVDV